MKQPLSGDDGDSTDTDGEHTTSHTTHHFVPLPNSSLSEVENRPIAVKHEPREVVIPSLAPNSMLAVMLAMEVEPPQQQPVNPPAPAVPAPSVRPIQPSCRLCGSTFDSEAVAIRHPNSTRMMRCGCCERRLPWINFSKSQRTKGSMGRCVVCVAAGPAALQRMAVVDQEAIQRRLEMENAKKEKQRATNEKRQATIARKKREREEAEQERLLRLGSLSTEEEEEHKGDDGDDEEEEEDEDFLNSTADHRRVAIALRRILSAHRSIERRRQANDLRTNDREPYELQLLEEEGRLHQHAAAVCAEYPEIYDQVCARLSMVDGAVRYGERDHEQGDNDQDKPKQPRRRRARKPVADPGHALLEAAKMTAQRMLMERSMTESSSRPSKRSKPSSPNSTVVIPDEEEPSSSVRTRSMRRRPSRAQNEVVTIDDDSDTE